MNAAELILSGLTEDMATRVALKHDVERHIQIGTELVAEMDYHAANRLGTEPQTARQPIETAPKDGTHILAWRTPIGIRTTNNTYPPTVVHWFDDPDEPGFYTSVNERAPEHPFEATHWMPLPHCQAESAPLDGAGAYRLVQEICEYTDNNLTMFDACDMPCDKARELHDMAIALRDRLALTRPERKP